MDFLREWVKNIVCYLCFAQIVEQLLPQGNYRKYVRFFCGLLLIVIVISPFLDAAGMSETLTSQWRTIMLREEWNSLEREREGLEQLRSETITRACREEIQRQVAAVAEGNGMENVQVQVTFSEGEGSLQMDSVRITGQYPDETKREMIQKNILGELSDIYQVKENQVVIG